MTKSERQALLNFATAVEELAQGCIHMAGMETVVKVCQTAELLKGALKDQDEEPYD